MPRTFRFALVIVLAAVLVGAWARGARAPSGPRPLPAPDGKPALADPSELSMEVTVLQTLYYLQPTPEQLRRLAELARRTAGDVPPRRIVKVSDRLRQTLIDLRAALLAGKDERVNELRERLDALYEKEDPDLEDVAEITDEARRQAPALLRRFGPRQLADYLGSFGPAFPDPAALLTGALGDARTASAREWPGLRDDVATRLGWLLGGLDEEAEASVRERVATLLSRARRLEDDAFRRQRPELERAAAALAGQVAPIDVLRHFMERTLAELLSNPRLAPAVAALRKQAERKEP